MDMHWWDLNTKPFRRFLLIIALLEESERHYHKTISPIFLLIILLMDMHFLEINTKPFHRFSANKNTYLQAWVGH